MSSSFPSALPASARKHVAASAGLFVGVRDFEDPELPKVLFAVDDAVDLAHRFVLELRLIDPQKTVLLLSGEPQKKASQERLAALEAAKVVRQPARTATVYDRVYRLGRQTGPEGLFVVSFATHGLTDQGRGVLALGESLKRRPVNTGLELDVVLDDLALAVAARRLVLVDACRERYDQGTRSATGDPVEPFGDAFMAAMEKARGCAILAGATRGGFAYDDLERENGVFTAALLDALAGGAEGDDSALVTLEGVADFAHRRVREWVVLNKPKHLHKSLGISKTYDPPDIGGLPLAINAKKQAAAFTRRRNDGLAHLVRLVGTTDVLFKEAARALEVERPIPEHFELLAEIEAFDGSQRLRRALRGFLDEAKEALGLDSSAKAVAVHIEPVAPPVVVADKPFWAAEAGEDQYGRWADLRVEKVVQRMRWIPPGEFWMGSPEGEAGRYSDEGPRHRVKLTQGFWLGDTPCTQELWQQVMGKNPSYFQSSRRPVETVSWDEVQEFLKQLKVRIPGGEAQLPTEAQWEYACRAGKETSTYLGELEILGENNAPLLDAIAWYGGNSGVGFEPADGDDSSGWPEKQYPHVKAGTREVGGKAPNAWGLYDMLGNVWEWCRDAGEVGQGYGSAEVATDPCGEVGSDRVFRGGSWSAYARDVRAASRYRGEPGFRDDDLGFRFSLGRPC